ncbi:MAG: hypothetical protein MRZ79_23185 [Bacteroidia bacterium]|nr:hypothetical protein [Bacteroidia bacterium]
MDTRIEILKQEVSAINEFLESGVYMENSTLNSPFLPPVSLEKVTQFEKKHTIQLPDAYRRFITEVADGGIGLLSLFTQKDEMEPTRVWARLEKEFPYSEKVNLYDELGRLPLKNNDYDVFKNIYKNTPEFFSDFLDLKAFKEDFKSKYAALHSRQLALFEGEYFFQGEHFYKELYEKIVDQYPFLPFHYNGILVVNDYGCAIYACLVVSGKARGEIWEIDMNGPDFSPNFRSDGKRMISYLDLVENTIQFLKNHVNRGWEKYEF